MEDEYDFSEFSNIQIHDDATIPTSEFDTIKVPDKDYESDYDFSEFDMPAEQQPVDDRLFGTPSRYTEEPGYSDKVEANVESITANYKMLEAERELQDFKTDTAKTKRIKADAIKESDLVEAPWYSSRTFTPESMLGYHKKRMNELEGNPDAPMLIENEMLQAGADADDIKAFQLSRRSYAANRTKDTTAESINRTATNIGRFFQDHINHEVVQGQAELGLGVMTIASDLIGGAGDLTDSETLANINNATSNYVEDIRAELDAQQKVYKERFNMNNAPAKMVSKYAPEAILGFYNPSTWVAMAGVEGGLTGTRAVGEGYSNSQAAAQAVVIGTVAGTIGKVADIALTKIFNKPTAIQLEGKTILSKGATEGEGAQRLTSLNDLPKTVKKEVMRLKKLNGWTEETTLKLINGYAKGAKSGKVNAQDTIRQLAQKGNVSSMEHLDLAYQSPELRKVALAEINKRSQEVLKVVKKKSPLGKIIYSNSNTLHSGGARSINWRDVFDAADNAGIDVTSPIMRKLAANREQFGDMDLGFHNTIKNIDMHHTPETIAEKATKFAYDATKLKFTLWANKATGVNALPNLNIVRRGVDLLEQTFHDKKVHKNLRAFIMNSVMDGPISPSAVEKAVLRQAPHLSDETVETIVQTATKLSTSAERAKLAEDATDMKVVDGVDLNIDDYTGMRGGHLAITPDGKAAKKLNSSIEANNAKIAELRQDKSRFDGEEYMMSEENSAKVGELVAENSYYKALLRGDKNAKANFDIKKLEHAGDDAGAAALREATYPVQEKIDTLKDMGFTKSSKGDTTVKKYGLDVTVNPDGIVNVDASAIPKGKNLAYGKYSKLWDDLEEAGLSYEPLGLNSDNELAVTRIMLDKIKKEGRDLPHIKIGHSQFGGVGLAGEPLTQENAKVLLDTVVDKIARKSTSSKRLNALTKQYLSKEWKDGNTDKMAIGAIILGLPGVAAILNEKEK